MRPIALFISLFCVLFLVGGCASVTRGTHEALEVKTSPTQAAVEIYRIDRGLTDKALKRNLSTERYEQIKAENAGKPALERFKGPISALSPGSFSLARNGEYRIQISKDGYQPATVQIKNDVAGGGAAGMAGNVLVGGIIGAGIDAGSGAMLKLVPNPVEVTLEAAKATEESAQISKDTTPMAATAAPALN